MNTEIIYESGDVSKGLTVSQGLTFCSYWYVVITTLFCVFWYPSNVYVPWLSWYQFYPVSMLIGFYISAVWNYKEKQSSAYPYLILLQFLFSIVGLGSNIAYITIASLIIGRTGGLTELYEGEYAYFNSADSTYYNVISDSALSTSNALKSWHYVIGQMSIGAFNILICIGSFSVSLNELGKANFNFPDMCRYHCLGDCSRKTGFRKAVQFLALVVLIWASVLCAFCFAYIGQLIIPIAAFQNQHCWFLMMFCLCLFPPIPFSETPTGKDAPDGIEVERSIYKASKRYCYAFTLDGPTALLFTGIILSFMITTYTTIAEKSFRDLNNLPTMTCGAVSEYTARLNGTTKILYFKSNLETPSLQTVNFTLIGSGTPDSYDWSCFNYATNWMFFSFHLLLVFLFAFSVFFVEKEIKVNQEEEGKLLEKVEKITMDPNDKNLTARLNKNLRPRFVGNSSSL